MNLRNRKKMEQSIKFSLILPTYNRGYCIERAIRSVLCQTYGNFELIIVDDGSTDGTEGIVARQFKKELACGRIRYLRQLENGGVCRSRNIGLAAAACDWIGYIDSDNTIAKSYLAFFAEAISEHPETRVFYANWKNRERGTKGSWYEGPFSYESLLMRNYIDLGVFLHHRNCYQALGGFDESLRRLVDWDLILRYTKEFPPVPVLHTVMSYNDGDMKDRITQKENLRVAFNCILGKHKPNAVKISVAIISYNQERFISQAIESVLCQRGAFLCEILLSDDGSTDRTPEIMAEYAEKYPTLIRNISSTENVGISANYKRCFAAATGKYVAVLEGDDFWKTSDKLLQQLQFLEANPDCSMVFSRIQIEDEDGNRIELRRQQYIYSTRLTGYDFLADRFLNLIVNFSCCMFITKYMQELPPLLYSLRLSEITLAFYLEQKGPLGYIPQVTSVYRKHDLGVWHGKTPEEKFRDGFEIRKLALLIAAPKYKKKLHDLICKQYVSAPLAEKLITEQDRQELEDALLTTEKANISRLGVVLLDGTEETDENHVEYMLTEFARTLDRIYVVCGGEPNDESRALLIKHGAAVIQLPFGYGMPTLEQIIAEYLPRNELYLYDEVVSIRIHSKKQVLKMQVPNQEKGKRFVRRPSRVAFLAERAYATAVTAARFYKKNGLKFTIKRVKEKILQKRKPKEPTVKLVD
ncbi:MAG: glycosyltransferase [Clostridiaceae bacterium]